LSKVIEACSDNAKIIEICQLGDKFIQEQCLNVYNKGKVAKGIAFPTSISINGALCHLSPLVSDPEAEWTLKAGEFARIELGVHVDGYIAQVAHTILVGASKVNFRLHANLSRILPLLESKLTLCKLLT
jgi:methionine aminopeptidase